MTTTGSLTGDVMDSSGHAVAGAKITVTSERTSEVRSANTNEAGTFTMIAVQPDTYNLRIEQKGFKVHERRGVSIAANEKVSLGDVTLQVGDVTETISVVGEAAQVQTDSSEHSAVLSSTQLTNLTARGREVVSMLRTISGCPVPGRSGFEWQLRHRHAQHWGLFFRHQHPRRGWRRFQRHRDAEHFLQRDYPGRHR